jgi:hypothetical protein
MATFNAEEKERVLTGVDAMTQFMAEFKGQIMKNTKWIEGNGTKGAKSRLDSAEARIWMLFVIAGTLATSFLGLVATIVGGIVVGWIMLQMNPAVAQHVVQLLR